MDPHIKSLPVDPRLELAALRLGHAVAQCVEIVGVPLHHLLALRQVRRLVIHAFEPDFLVGQVHVSPVFIPAKFGQQRLAGVATAVASHSAFVADQRKALVD